MHWFQILDLIAWLLSLAANAATCVAALAVVVIAFKLKKS